MSHIRLSWLDSYYNIPTHIIFTGIIAHTTKKQRFIILLFISILYLSLLSFVKVLRFFLHNAYSCFTFDP